MAGAQPKVSGSDLTAFALQLEELRPAAERFARRLLRHVHDAEEAVQDAFLRLLRARDQFEGRSSLRTYVFAAVRNSCIDRRRFLHDILFRTRLQHVTYK